MSDSHDPVIEMVVVSVNYGDFLCETITSMKAAADYLVVVTDTKDDRTARICEWNQVHCVRTDAFYTDGSKFNKGLGINEGLKVLSRRDYVLHSDSDCIFPPHFKDLIKTLIKKGGIKPDWIYGVDRVMVPSYEAWVDFKNNPNVQYTSDIFCIPPKFDLGVRVAKNINGPEYMPIGYVQLFNPSGAGLTDPIYPQYHLADRSDMMMAQKYPREKRGLIPEAWVMHLQTSREQGANWSGRTTPFFGPTTGAFAQKIVPIPKEVAQDITLQKQAALSSDNNTFPAYGD